MAEWQYYNPSPVNRSVGDCAVRALTKALGVDWETAYTRLAIGGYQMADMPSSNAVIAAVLRQAGFYRHIIPNTCPDCYTISDFADDQPDGLYIVGTGTHIVVVEDGTVFDSWNSLGEIPIFYWSKEAE